MYIVIEIQTSVSNTVSTIVTAYNSLEQAYSAYYNILHTAAVSSIPVHGAVILNNHGNLIDSREFIHEVEANET